MIKIFGYTCGTARAAVRYTRDGDVRFYIDREWPVGPSGELTGDALSNALPLMKPIDSGAILGADQVKALQGAVEVLIDDLTTTKRR